VGHWSRLKKPDRQARWSKVNTVSQLSVDYFSLRGIILDQDWLHLIEMP
jgi:hypothetical protein